MSEKMDEWTAAWEAELSRNPRTRTILAREMKITQKNLQSAVTSPARFLSTIVRTIATLSARISEVERITAEHDQWMRAIEARVEKLERARAESESYRRHNALRLSKVEREIAQSKSLEGE